MHEAKRGVNAPNPQFQFYGEILAAAWFNYEKKIMERVERIKIPQTQRIFGCYTIVDDWTFVRVLVSSIETEKPTLNIEISPRYKGTTDAERIVQLLKFIVSEQCNN